MSPASRVAALLRAGRAERPPEGNEEHLLTALGVGAGAVSGFSLAGAAVRTWLRWMGLGLLLGAVSMTGAWAIGEGGPRPGEDIASPGTADREDPFAPRPVTLEGRASVERAAATPHLLPTRALVTSSPIAAGPADHELVLIRDARLALQRGDAGAALWGLDEHARAFPRGVFQEEASALRVEALVAAGRRDEAHRAAVAFDAAYPHSPYGPRIRRYADP